MDGDRQLPAEQRQLIEAPTNITPGFKPWSPGLGRLLTDGDDGRSAVRLIAINATLRAEAERLLPQLEAAKAPATEEELLEILVRHAPQYGITAKMAGEWGAFFGAYLDALHGLSPYAVEEAFVRWNRGESPAGQAWKDFYPRSAQLVLLAQEARAEIACAAYRAKRAMEYVEKQTPRQISDEERRKVAEDFKKLAAMTAPRRMPVAPPPPRWTQAEAAARILRAAATSAPPADDVGDVI
jgi:hypothetical protein